MTTPIADFIEQYKSSGISRLHMPGHKGVALSGPESGDITEIGGADELYEADGIIEESENNASALFGTAHTFYSTEGSSLTIKAMLMIAMQNSPHKSESPYVLAARNVHKTFIYGCALLGLDAEWIYPEESNSLCSCIISAENLRSAIEECLSKRGELPIGVYLTSPDYLGNLQDIKSLSAVCKEFSIPLLVDNAHGAYLKFLTPSLHPISLGSDICCDSAHKTLPALTGGAYLHISRNAPSEYVRTARNALTVFASTSPSYLILKSLDCVNKYLNGDYSERLSVCIDKIFHLKEKLKSFGWIVADSEPLKLVLDCVRSETDGNVVMAELRKNKIECEFGSFENIVMMFTPENPDADYTRIEEALSTVPVVRNYVRAEVSVVKGVKKLSLREAILSPYEELNPKEAVGRICASPAVSCPPAIPIAISGEVISEESVKLFRLYGIDSVRVVK